MVSAPLENVLLDGPSLQGLKSCATHFSTPRALSSLCAQGKAGCYTGFQSWLHFYHLCWMVSCGPPAPTSFSALVHFAQCPRSCFPWTVPGPGTPALLSCCVQLGLAEGWRREKFLCSFPAGSGGRPWRPQLLLGASLD